MNDREPLTIHQAAAAMQAGTLTPVDLLDQCLARIELYESHVRAWVVVDRDGARRQAERLTDEMKQGRVRGPLHGIPVGVKDIIDVFDLPTGCGSRLWADSIARQDAVCVKRLRDAGAVILGKTVTTAFAFLDPPVTRNPWNPTRTPGGSSSGSAAAVSCGMCLAALGTQTGGSITRPASYCGVASCKPTWWRIGTDGVLPFAPSLDHVGVMARCIRDLNLPLRAISDSLPPCRGGLGWGVTATRHPNPPPQGGREQSVFRLGRLRGPFEERADPDVLEPLSKLTGDRIEVVDVTLPPRFAEVWPSHRAIMAVEAAQVHGDRFRRHPDDYPPRITELIEEGRRLGEEVLSRELTRREELRRKGIPEFARLHALLTPATTGPAPGRETTGDPYFNVPWSYFGLPTVSIPAGVGREHKMPVALQLVGQPACELVVLAAAAVCEEQIGREAGLPPAPDEVARET